MRLYVMRHGPAEDSAPSRRDFDRTLSAAGREVVKATAEDLLRLRGEPIARILSSPLLRARETAEIVSVVAGEGPESMDLHDELGADQPVPLGLVQRLLVASTDALLVGHQPSVEMLVRHLCPESGPHFAKGFQTAMVVTLERVADAWSLGSVLRRLG